MISPSDRHAWIVFGILLALCVVDGALFFIDERPLREVKTGDKISQVAAGHGVPHERVEGMFVGGDGESRHGHIFWLAWSFAVLQIALLCGGLLIGMKKREAWGPARGWVIGASIIGALIMTMVFLSYRPFMLGEDYSFVFGFPIASAWLVYGVWGFPVLYVTLYVVVFDRWYVTRETMDGLRAIVARAGADEESDVG
jgi:hypothetical protein